MDSLADFSSSPLQGTFRHVNAHSDLVHPNDGTEDAHVKAEVPALQANQPFLSSRIWEDYGDPGDDAFFKSFPVMPSPQNIPQNVPQNNDMIPFFDLEPGATDAETGSKVSSESSSSGDGLASLHQQNGLFHSHAERKSISIFDVCNQTEVLTERTSRPGKRKRTRETGNNYPNPNSTKKKRKVTQPSKFCHICVRSYEQVKMIPCAKVAASQCRKNVCKRCFERHGIAHEWATALHNIDLIPRVQAGEFPQMPDGAWTCLHCRKMCPRNAQCTIYQRTNKRRHDSLRERKVMRIEREREMARQGLVPQYDDPRTRNAVDGIISPTGLPNLPLPMPLPPDLIPDSDRFFRGGLPPAVDDLPLASVNASAETQAI